MGKVFSEFCVPFATLRSSRHIILLAEYPADLSAHGLLNSFSQQEACYCIEGLSSSPLSGGQIHRIQRTYFKVGLGGVGRDGWLSGLKQNYPFASEYNDLLL